MASLWKVPVPRRRAHGGPCSPLLGQLLRPESLWLVESDSHRLVADYVTVHRRHGHVGCEEEKKNIMWV